MIWPVCFISVAHLFQIHLYTSDLDKVSDLIFPLDLSWTEQREFVGQSSRNAVRIRPCATSRHSLLIARCNLIDAHGQPFYRCDPLDLDQQTPERRSKRAADTKAKRPSALFLALAIGIPCLIVGIVGGLIFMAFYLLKRRSQVPQASPKMKSLDITPPPMTHPM